MDLFKGLQIATVSFLSGAAMLLSGSTATAQSNGTQGAGDGGFSSNDGNTNSNTGPGGTIINGNVVDDSSSANAGASATGVAGDVHGGNGGNATGGSVGDLSTGASTASTGPVTVSGGSTNFSNDVDARGGAFAYAAPALLPSIEDCASARAGAIAGGSPFIASIGFSFSRITPAGVPATNFTTQDYLNMSSDERTAATDGFSRTDLKTLFCSANELELYHSNNDSKYAAQILAAGAELQAQTGDTYVIDNALAQRALSGGSERSQAYAMAACAVSGRGRTVISAEACEQIQRGASDMFVEKWAIDVTPAPAGQ